LRRKDGEGRTLGERKKGGNQTNGGLGGETYWGGEHTFRERRPLCPDARGGREGLKYLVKNAGRAQIHAGAKGAFYENSGP